MSDVVTLRGGLTVPARVLRFGRALEARGVTSARDGSSLTCEPADLLKPDERETIRAWKGDLLLVVDYSDRRDWRASTRRGHCCAYLASSGPKSLTFRAKDDSGQAAGSALRASPVLGAAALLGLSDRRAAGGGLRATASRR